MLLVSVVVDEAPLLCVLVLQETKKIAVIESITILSIGKYFQNVKKSKDAGKTIPN